LGVEVSKMWGVRYGGTIPFGFVTLARFVLMLERVVVLLFSGIIFDGRFGLHFDASDGSNERSEVECWC
jgi:hypothetical protein